MIFFLFAFFFCQVALCAEVPDAGALEPIRMALFLIHHTSPQVQPLEDATLSIGEAAVYSAMQTIGETNTVTEEDLIKIYKGLK
jgi:hypothetical protein